MSGDCGECFFIRGFYAVFIGRAVGGGRGFGRCAADDGGGDLRHIFYGLSFPAAAFQEHRRALGYAMFSLTDEAYSVCTQLAKQADWRLLTWVLLLCHLYWIGGTVLGVLASWLVPPQVFGFDFALAALFTVLAQHHVYYPERCPALFLGLTAIAAALLLVHASGIDSKQTLALAIAVLLVLLFVTPRRFLLTQGGNV